MASFRTLSQHIGISLLVTATTLLGQGQATTAKSTKKALEPEVQWVQYVPEATSELRERGPYSRFQLRGKPNILTVKGDTNPCSWVAAGDGNNAKPDAEARLVVAFEHPVYAQQIAIAENLNPGAVTEVILRGEKETERDTVYKTIPSMPGTRWRMLNVFFNKTSFKVKEAELRVQYGMVPGWNEIDAIALGTTKDTIKPIIELAQSYSLVATDLNKVENLGTTVNTEHDEILPIISPDGKKLYFCRVGHPGNVGITKREDVWVSTFNDSTKTWSESENIGSPINNIHSNFLVSIMPDANTAFVGNKYLSNGRSAAGISVTYKQKDGTWSFPTALEIDDFHNRGRYLNYFIAADGKTLLMAIVRDIGFGNMDLFVSFKKEDGAWTAPKNLGPDINTAGNESTIFLAPDNQTIYFSSEGHNGYGKNDLFVARRLDSTWERWSEPVNLGPSVNSDQWDGYFSIPASGDYGYFVSSAKAYGKNDIFRVPINKALKPRPLALLSGKTLAAKDGSAVQASIKVERLSDGKEVGIALSNPTTGEFAISLPAGEKYGFRAELEGYIPVSENIDLTKLEEYTELQRNLLMVKIEKGSTVRINNIFFETGKFELQPESLAELRRLVKILQTNPDMKIRVEGHTDNVGKKEANQLLSKNRATAVVNFLIKEGIQASRVEALGLGQEQPIAPNTTEEGRQQNRRVEFRIQ